VSDTIKVTVSSTVAFGSCSYAAHLDGGDAKVAAALIQQVEAKAREEGHEVTGTEVFAVAARRTGMVTRIVPLEEARYGDVVVVSVIAHHAMTVTR
jgi:hypothetical protein